MKTLEDMQKTYQMEHTSTGCKITHMFGVPMIALSLPLLFFDRKKALMLFTAGWILQLTGHYLFERNKPTLTKNPFDPLTYMASLIFVSKEWLSLLSSRKS